MSVLGVLCCEVLELEFAHLLSTDGDIRRLTVLDDGRSARLLSALGASRDGEVRRISALEEFAPSGGGHPEVLVRVLELGLHIWPKMLREALVEATREMSRHADALLLGYGLCGNALESPRELLADISVPVFLPMDQDHPVDDCVGLLIGGRERYYEEQCKVAGTFFITPGWAHHWRRMFEREMGTMSIDLARRMFEHYERALLISSPVTSDQEMRENIREFVDMFGFRIEACSGTLGILTRTWEEAKSSLQAPAG